MTDHMDRPFSRFYAQLVGDEEETADDGDRDPLGSPTLANPRRLSDTDT